MIHKKLILSVLLAVMLLTAPMIGVSAAPAAQEPTPITGKVASISINTDTETVEVTVVVVVDEAGTTQTISLSLEEATTLGFVINDGNLSTDESKIGEIITYPPIMLVSVVEDENEHPVGSAIADFFSDLFGSDMLGVDYDTIMTYHDDGVGFGVIAQALWMTYALAGDTDTFTDTFKEILYAKENKDFSAITLPDGSTPTNWGQFRKAVMSDRERFKANLGMIMSGKAEKEKDMEIQNTLKDHGKPNDKGKPDKKDKDKNGNGNNKNK